MDPVRELPYWPAAMALLIEAGQMTASDYVPAYPNLPLASEGASTDAERTHQTTWRRIGAILENFPPQECANYFRAAGYASD